jgi:polysaccharide export outer membrane protein
MRVVAILMTFSVLGCAQYRPNLMDEAGRANLPSQKLGADDLIAVSVYDAPELTRTVRVENDGTIHLPLLKNGVEAAGLYPGQVETGIATALRNEQILVDPVVKVTVVEYHSRPISVMGAVRKPVTFQAVGTVTVLEALAQAEGFSPDAGSEVLLTRGGQVERIPVQRLIKDADPAVNYILHGGEEVRVPEAGKIFVLGNVRRPGAIPIKDPGDRSVLKAIAVSEGLAPYADKIAYVYRRGESGAKVEIPVELEKIMQRKAPDVPLEVDDILYIPDNKTRRVAVTALDRIAMFGASTASGLLIWH